MELLFAIQIVFPIVGDRARGLQSSGNRWIGLAEENELEHKCCFFTGTNLELQFPVQIAFPIVGDMGSGTQRQWKQLGLIC